MRNGDVEELFELVSAGDVVELQNERTAAVVAIFGAEPQAVPLYANAGQ